MPSVIAAMLAASITVGCSGASPQGASTVPAEDAPGGSGSVVLFRVITLSAMSGPGHAYVTLPDLSVYADGTVVMRRPPRKPYDVLDGLITLRLSEDGLTRLRLRALDAGIGRQSERLSLPVPGSADGDSTRFELILSGRSSSAHVSNLGADTLRGVPSSSGSLPGWPSDIELIRLSLARAKFVDLLAWLRDMPSWADLMERPRPYAVTRLAVLSRPYTIPDAPWAAGIRSRPTVEWPLTLGEELHGAKGVRCAIVEGKAIEQARTLIQQAAPPPGKHFRLPDEEDDEEKLRSISVRPLFPDETSCEDLWLTAFGHPSSVPPSGRVPIPAPTSTSPTLQH